MPAEHREPPPRSDAEDVVRRKIVYVSEPADTPDWVKPIVTAARNLAVA